MFPSSLQSAVSDARSTATNAAGGAWKAFQSSTGLFVNPEDPETMREQSFGEEMSEMSSLTRMQRIYGFFMAIGMGVVFFVIAMTLLPVVTLVPKKFAFFYTCGNVFLLLSTTFVVGFRKQCEVMLESNRFQVATVYAASMFLTLASAMHWHSGIAALIFSCAQLAAALWYALSFIPFARQTFHMVWSYLLVILRPIMAAVSSLMWQCLRCVCSRK